jgi:hypothetical protein
VQRVIRTVSFSSQVHRGLVALLTPALLVAGATGCGIVSCGAPPPERIPEHLAGSGIVLTPDAELVGVGYGCWQDDSIYFTIAVPPESVDDLLRASHFEAPMEPLVYPAQVGDGGTLDTVEPGPEVFEARDEARHVVVDYSDPDQPMVYIND